ncbi:MAG: DNA replication and repair protein RecF [Myxococcota bacterium]|nr:DNA replication and repair protein RecF [Myxococcota bacterium]MEC9391036.1 DNA replication and repair protein RecF [Myxococcota bacterium]
MQLTKLQLAGWRNVADCSIEVNSPLVVVHGDNGQGKSNLLEAVHVLGTLKSFREPKTRRWIRHGAESARIAGCVQSTVGRRELTWKWTSDGRRLQMDEKQTAVLSDWFDVFRAVVFCPEDAAIVRGEPDKRRRFMDRAAFNAAPTHLRRVTEYRRVLNHKRALLSERHIDPLQLDAFNESLARTAAAVVAARVHVIEELKESFEGMHEAIAGSGRVDMHVSISGLGRVESTDVGDLEVQLRAALASVRQDELHRKTALVGPHRDDLVLTIDGQRARNFASQGQARSVILGLKLAELDAAHRRGVVPVFLLDDLTSELDQGRRERLVAILTGLKGQVWVTTTDPSYLGDLTAIDHIKLRVSDGEINPD